MSLQSMLSRGARVRSLAVLGAAVTALAIPAMASANPSNIETGRASDITTDLAGITAQVGPDTGLISTNTTTTTALSTAHAHAPGLLSADVLSAEVDTFKTESATSTAKVASAGVTLAPLPGISAKVIQATSTASCRAGGTLLAGGATGTVTIAGKSYDIAAKPNFVINLGLGTVELNEQIKNGNSLTVNAIHVRLPANGSIAQVVISSAYAGVSNCAG